MPVVNIPNQVDVNLTNGTLEVEVESQVEISGQYRSNVKRPCSLHETKIIVLSINQVRAAHPEPVAQ